ncbi:MAG: primosomal protein N' [Gammaproteobacteria bacterium]|nr:primosomal protein N' [Gammaproteobacteria bacterium]
MTNETPVIRVAVPLPIREGLDYLWAGPGPAPAPGCRVQVPVARKSHTGIVIEHPATSPVGVDKLKRATTALDAQPIIAADLLETLVWCASYYHHPIGEVISAALPALLRRGRTAAPAPEIRWHLTADGREIDTAALARRARRQAALLEHLAATDSAAEADLREAGYTRAQLANLEEKGWFASLEADPPARAQSTAYAPESAPVLTADQSGALEAIAATEPGYHAFLLHGVTGSGKTEVYMRLIAEQIRARRQSLLLVPEISLTPQLVGRLERRFGEHLAVMHSALTDNERLDAWQRCRSGDAGLVVGTRSAVFAPLASPGLVIVDEEHDTSYKQAEGFRYSARDLAVFRAQRLGIPVVLGSATPSLESLHNAEQGRYTLVRMPRRIGSAGSPTVRVIDLNHHAVRNGISTPMLSAIEQHLESGNQVMLFLNRRGFAPVLFCPECGVAEECQHCDSRMTIHAASGRLRCHHCGAERALKWACASCGTERKAVGAGTQRVSEELRALYPNVGIGRLDRDATSRRGSLESVLADLETGKTQILVGTQMLAKGHDFPNVTLVGILNADQGLFGTDFRSNERLVQTIIQVAGRAGRADRPGEVLVQSHFPSHPLFECLLDQDYARFAELALAERRATDWPPFSHLVLWRASAVQRAAAFDYLRRLAGAARALGADIEVHGPAPAGMERRGGRYRAQVLLQCARRGPLHAAVDELLQRTRSWPEARKVRWAVDVDPAEL